MTDQPGPRDDAQERLPAPRPASAPVPAERFSAAPSAHRNDLTPERTGRIVRQSANARWIGFLAVTITSLFIIGYYFYELGVPGGVTEPRLQQAADDQQVTAVQRGYNLYEANCAQCHGPNGEGGKGPQLNRQDKLFAHLNPDYIRNVLTVGGRYVCGNPKSIMPVWSNAGNPPGPLNYKQIDYLIAFLRAEKGTTYTVLDPSLNEPVVDPATGKEKTFQGWVDPNYKPAPGATPFPDCWTQEFSNAAASPGGSAAPGASGAPGGSAAPGSSGGPAASAPASGSPSGNVVQEAAQNIAFVNKELTAPADQAFQIEFDNQDPGQPHNIEIKDASGATVFKGDIVTGPTKTTYSVTALKAGSYPFVCSVHPNMTGTLTVGS
jgi:mono/diheme cytochrome c family protein/plastocyanin